MPNKKWYEGVTPEWINAMRNLMINIDHGMVMASQRSDLDENEYLLPDWLPDMRDEIEELKEYLIVWREETGRKTVLFEEDNAA